MPDRTGDASQPGPGATGPVVVFTIDGREFAVAMASVIEIVAHRGGTPVPSPAAAIEAIVPVRGRMVTLINVRRGLGMESRRGAAGEQVIVIESAGDRLGLVVDGVARVAVPQGGVEMLDIDMLVRPST